MTADFSSLKMRGFAYSLTSSSYIITAFGVPKAAETIYESNWCWGFGAWTIVLPVVPAPMIYMLQRGKCLAKENGLLDREMFLLNAGFVLFFLPFTIAADSEDQWRSAYFISMLVLGLVLIAVFALWERVGASVPVVPRKLLKSPCVMGSLRHFQVASGYINNTFNVVSGIELFLVGILIRWSGRHNRSEAQMMRN
ncbi:hypothetical protein MY1884_009692, partial [Beauveria asiatica]